MQYGFAYAVLILAAWKSAELIVKGIRGVKHIFKGGGGEYDI